METIMPRQRNTEVRQQILCTAYNFFLEKGYENTKIKDIATACNISPALLNHYFDRKESILVTICASFILRTAEFLDREIAVFDHVPDDMKNPLWFGLYYHLLYEYMCLNHYKLLNLYSFCLFDTQLLSNAVRISIAKISKYNTFSKNSRDFIESVGTYLLQGCFAQLVSLYLRDKNLVVPYEIIVETALSAFFRILRMTPEEEKEAFEWIHKTLSEGLRQEHILFQEEHKYEFLPFYD